MANVAAQRRTSEQQQEHVRQLEEREKSLYSQVVSRVTKTGEGKDLHDYASFCRLKRRVKFSKPYVL